MQYNYVQNTCAVMDIGHLEVIPSGQENYISNVNVTAPYARDVSACKFPLPVELIYMDPKGH